jgi:hypothetical protein
MALPWVLFVQRASSHSVASIILHSWRGIKTLLHPCNIPTHGDEGHVSLTTGEGQARVPDSTAEKLERRREPLTVPIRAAMISLKYCDLLVATKSTLNVRNVSTKIRPIVAACQLLANVERQFAMFKLLLTGRGAAGGLLTSAFHHCGHSASVQQALANPLAQIRSVLAGG